MTITQCTRRPYKVDCLCPRRDDSVVGVDECVGTFNCETIVLSSHSARAPWPRG